MTLDENLLELDTEKPGKAYPANALNEIQFRYSFACKFVSNKKVVEIGFGAGYGVVDLATRSRSYLGIDILDSNRLLAKKRLSEAGLLDRANVSRGDATEIPVADKSADILIAFAIIYYLDVPAFFAEARRVLKHNGSFVFCQTNPLAMNFSPSRNTVKYYKRDEIVSLLLEAGFSCQIYGISELDSFSANKYNISGKIKALFKHRMPVLYAYLRKALVKYEELPEKIFLNEADPRLKKLQVVTQKNESAVRILYVVASKLHEE